MPNAPTGDTKEKLLRAASEIFVEKGFREATVAEISRRAGANVAAVNYHFGSKKALYREAWRYAFSESMKAHPQDGGVGREAPPEDRLRGRVRALIERIADENTRDFFISQREFVNPTGLLREVMKAEMIPLREKTLSLMRELLGPEVAGQQVVFCEMSIIGMCLHPILIQRAHRRSNDPGIPPAIDDFDAFVDHVVRFALAGIAAVRGDTRTEGRPFAGKAKP
jgi:AcrR family transcriptional regulator